MDIQTVAIVSGLLVVALAVAAHLLSAGAQSYKLNFTRSPDETNGSVLSYVGVWAYTNSFSTNSVVTNWFNFGTAPAGTTNIIINSTVASPAYLAVETQSTNYLLSPPTNIVLYSTNALALIYTNTPAAPRAPGVPTLSQ
jgi:hypothetical protein